MWSYFGFLTSDKKLSSVHFKLCEKPAPAKTGHTSNPFLPSEPVPTFDSRLQSIRLNKVYNNGPSCPLLPHNIKKQRVISQNQQASFTAKDGAKKHGRKNVGFRQAIKVTDPCYQLTGYKYFSQAAFPKLNTVCKVIKRHVKSRFKVYHNALTH